MSKPKHRKFRADAFVDVFAEHLYLLRDFVRHYDPVQFPNPDDCTASAFKDIAAEAVKTQPGMVEHLYRAYDLSKHSEGYELLSEVMKEKKLGVDHSLPVECLAIWLHNEDQDAFNFAYDRMCFNEVDRVTLYRATPREQFQPESADTEAFKQKLSAFFEHKKGSGNVLVRQFLDNGSLNLIVYHEKNTVAQLVFKERKDAVGPQMLRPAKQDSLSFNSATGELQVDASYSNEIAALRQAFAGSFLGDPELFERPEATQVFNLNAIADPEFALAVTGFGHSAVLKQLKFKLFDGSASFDIKSKNVLQTLEVTGLRSRMRGAEVSLAKIHLCLGSGRRDRKTVELKGNNQLVYNASTHKETVENYLRDWGLLNSYEPARLSA